MARKKNIPTMPFDTGSWLSSPGLKQLTPDIRGLWVDLLCYMWESAERGFMVKPNQKKYTREEIIRLVGVDSAGSDDWLDRLVSAGLCGIREDGTYYSCQMVKAEAIRAKRREAGKKGGDITKAKVFSAIPKTPPAVESQSGQGELFAPIETVPESPPPLTPEQKAKADKAKKYKYAEFVTLTRDEYATLCETYGEEVAKRMIEILDNYKGSKGRKYKSDYRAILSWVVDRYNEAVQKYGCKINGGAFETPKPTDTPAYSDTL